jgi:hypothetical protein
VWEYGGRNGKAFRDWKSSKTKMFQEPENLEITSDLKKQ